MAKRKVKAKKFGLRENEYCPWCEKKVSMTRYLLPAGTGYLIEHSWNSKVCAFIPFPRAVIMTKELLRQDNVVDIVRLYD